MAKEVGIVGIGLRGQLRHQGFAGGGKAQALLAGAAIGQLSYSQPFFFQPGHDLGRRTLGHAQGLYQLGVCGFILRPERAQCHPFGDSDALLFKQLLEAV